MNTDRRVFLGQLLAGAVAAACPLIPVAPPVSDLRRQWEAVFGPVDSQKTKDTVTWLSRDVAVDQAVDELHALLRARGIRCVDCRRMSPAEKQAAIAAFYG